MDERAFRLSWFVLQVDAMTPESEILLAALRGKWVGPPESIDWPAVLELADRHGVLPLFSRGFPDELPEAVVRHVRTQWARSAHLASELEGLLKQFSLEGIEVLPMKGPLLAQTLYGSASLRPSYDLDLLVQPQDFVRAQSTLLGLGFEPACEVNSYHQTFQLLDTIVELHFAIAPPSSPAMDLQAAWHRAQIIEFRGQRARFFSKSDLLIYLVIHGVKHNFARLIWVLDVGLALGNLTEDDVSQVLNMARTVGLEGALLTACEAARLALEIELPSQIAAAIAHRPVISSQAAVMWERILMGPANPQTSHQGAGVFIQLEPDARQRWAQRLRFFKLSQEDHLWARNHDIDPRWMPLFRPFRLLSKHGAVAVWRTFYPLRR